MHRFVGLAAALTVALGMGAHHARAVAPAPASPDDVIQVLADLTAIDLDCHDLSVNFGIGFRYASDQGFTPASVLPTGKRRPAFDRALRSTQDNFGAIVVCGALAHHYSVALPGSVTFPPDPRSGS